MFRHSLTACVDLPARHEAECEALERMHASLKPLLELNAQRIKYRDQLNVRDACIAAGLATCDWPF
jgi:hypothetical protein